MPYIVRGNTSNQQIDYSKKDFNYTYPEGMKLKPGSPLHDKLRDEIIQRANEARNEISKRFDSWNDIDRSLTIYMPTKDYEKVKKSSVEEVDPDKPINIVFPYSYSMLEALLTYLSMAFFQDPMFRYEGVEPNDTVGAMLMELVVKMHCIKNKVPLSLHTILRDSLAYGVGIGIPGWHIQYGKRPVKTQLSLESELGLVTNNGVEFIDDVIFEGNNLTSIDPYMWLPDPSVSSDSIQDGEFIGWIERTNYMNLLTDESSGKDIFNVRYLKVKADKRSTLALDNSERSLKTGMSSDSMRDSSMSINPVDVIKMYITLIPEDWGLSNVDTPEKWFFALAADDIIISAQRADHNHGMYPIAVASPEFDGYSIAPIGRMEILYGLQHTLDFLFNSHISNVKKAINDMLIVDPFLVNINDLKDPKPGKLIRLRRPAWGRGVDKVVQQLAVSDITRANIADSGYITQWMDRISGADQSMQGMLRQGGPERLTKSEFQGTRGSATSRLQRIAMLISMQFMQDIGTMFASHTQQYMSKDVYVKLTGDYQSTLAKQFGPDRAKVSPFDLAINYDLIVRDGSIPGANFSDSWLQLFQTIGTSPELMQQFDIVRIFSYIAQQLGAKNIEDFKRVTNATTPVQMPDVNVQNQVRAGNMIPVGSVF